MNKVLKVMAEGRFFNSIFEVLKKGVQQFFKKADGIIGTITRHIILKGKKIKNNKIVFMTYDNQFMCNPKYIAEEIHRQNLPYELVWVVGSNEKELYKYPSYLKLVRRGSYEAFLELATAKVWIDNSLNCIWQSIPKKKEQIYIETWHGSLGLKREGAQDVKNRYWVKVAGKMKKYTDYCISNSTFEDMVYRETHWPKTKIWQFGHARNDILLADEERQQKIKDKIFKCFSISKDTKIAIYAPTFRDNNSFDCYNIDFDRLIEALEKRFGGTWKIFLRFHFHERKNGLLIEGNNSVINVTSYVDMQELLVASDVGVSDYSSWLCDFVLMHKPAFIYAVDIEHYSKERGFYYPLESTPFPIAKNNEELYENITSFNEEQYINKAKAFIEDKGCIDDGSASERIVKEIKTLIQNTKGSDVK